MAPAAFLVIACFVAAHAEGAVATFVHAPSMRSFLLAIYALLRTAVAFAFAVFTLNRAEPQRHSRELPAFVACTVAMLAIALVTAPPHGTPEAMLIAGDAVAVTGCTWLLASVLALGRCFGVLPEARGLVIRGPYRLVRHPVYLGEIVALAGLTLAAPTTWNAAVLVLFLVAQIVRAHLEERALSAAFPDYGGYAARTGRLVPRIQGIRKPIITATALKTKGAE